jgi:poly-gamma-glutamate capsule biosynthesis protein CapA/YwtB (metallophosphatase superfamily)
MTGTLIMNSGRNRSKAKIFILAAVAAFALCSNAWSGEILRVAAVGDVMMGSTHPEPFLPPDDGKGHFEGVKPFFEGAEIVFGNLEGPLVDKGASSKCRKGSTMCYAFSTPTRYGMYLKEAGFNLLNLANNHANDFGEKGQKSTIGILDSLGIRSIGGSRTAQIIIGEKKIGAVGFSFSTPVPYSVSDIASARQVVAGLKKVNDIVIVSFHGGAEGKQALHTPNSVEMFAGENRGNVIAFSRAMIDAGADLVLGHGPHVLRAMELYKDKLIVYSMGNFLTFGRFNISGENGISAVFRIDLDLENGNFSGGRIRPVKLANGGIPMPDSDKSAVRLLRELTIKDIGKSGPSIGDNGEIFRNPAEAADNGL